MKGLYLLDSFFNSILEYDIYIKIFGLTCFVLAAFTFYKKCRPYFNIRVNCWFCNYNTWVPYQSRNCFECPRCDQYNGFSPDGNYNTDVLNRKRSSDKFINSKPLSPVKPAENGLCEKCNTNQRLKIHQLASFTPINEKNYDQEIQQYRDQLERSYGLCERCSLVVTQTLQTQQYQLLTNRLNGQCRVTPPACSATKYRWQIVKALHLGDIVCGALLVAASTTKVLPMLSAFSWIDQVLKESHADGLISSYMEYTLGISLIGSISNFCGIIVRLEKPQKAEMLKVASWISRVAVSWLSNPLIIFSVHIMGFGMDLVLGNKVKNIGDVEVVFKNAPVIKPIVPAAIAKVAPVAQPVRVVPETPKIPSSVKNKGNIAAEPIEETPSRMETRSQTAKRSEKCSDESFARRGRLSSPPPEFYDGFNSLRLSSPPRELTSPVIQPVHNPQNNNKGKSIIKPSKLSYDTSDRSTRSPFTPQEPTRPTSVSRISPNSAFVQNTEKDVQYPPLCVSPIPYRMSAQDLYSGSPTPCFSDMPIGQTTIYTYGRPGPYQYHFPPQPFSPTSFPSFYESPGFPSNFSNSSVRSENVTSSPLEGWFKYGLYATSVLFNLITMVMMAIYFFRN